MLGRAGACCPPAGALSASLRTLWPAQLAAAGAPRHRCAAAKQARDSLAWVDAEHRKDVAAILDQAERVRWEVCYTHFLPPPVAADALAALARVPELVALPWGGYPQAERVRLALGREEVMAAAQADPGAALPEAVAALDVRGNFMFDAASHRDFLGAIIGTGVVRDRIGDILLQGEGGAQILVDPLLVEHFEAALTRVRTVPVETRAIPLAQLRVAAPQRSELTSIEASLRLDAVASAGFRMSRSKLADLVRAGDVRLNWRPAAKASAEVRQGDVIAVAGKGRLEVGEIGRTKKDKFVVTMVRYV